MAHALKAIGEQRGWNHNNHQNIKDIGDHMANEFDHDDFHGLVVKADAMHRNFYKNEHQSDNIRSAFGRAESFVTGLDQLRNEPPQLFTIAESADQRRLGRLLRIPKEGFQRRLSIGGHDPNGFSLDPDNGDGSSRATQAAPSPPSDPPPTIQEPVPGYSPSGSTDALTVADLWWRRRLPPGPKDVSWSPRKQVPTPPRMKGARCRWARCAGRRGQCSQGRGAGPKGQPFHH